MNNVIFNKNNRYQNKRIGYIFTIAIVEIIIFWIFINILSSEGMDNKLFLAFFGIIIVFFTIQKFKKIVKFAEESFSHYNFFAVFFIILLLFFIPIQFKNNVYLLHICIMTCLYGIASSGLNIVIGDVGLVSLAFAAFFGVGAYTSVLLTINFQTSFWLGILGAIILTALSGLLIGLITLKSIKVYYALMTIAFQTIFHLLVNNLNFTGGAGGITNIPFPTIGKYSFGSSLNIFGIELPYQANFYYFALIALIFSLYLISALHNSRTGLVWNAIKEDEIAAQCQGIKIIHGKLTASAIGSGFAGMAGAIYAHYIGYISPESFNISISIIFLSMVLLGGINNLYGVVLGAVILTVIPEKIRFFSEARMLLYGLIIISVLLFKPQGLIPEKIRKYKFFKF